METINENKKENVNEMDKLIRESYNKAIKYYWGASDSNKRWYKITRSLTVIIGATVTLIASLASSEIIVSSPWMKTTFTLGTPILAAILTIVAGFSQSFQWGSAWQNMVLTAERLQKEFDIYKVTPLDERNYLEEAEKLNNYVITESEGFFERMLGTVRRTTKDEEPNNNENGK
jgi:hypothetical protein